jgi:hypothetical protein
VKIVLAIVTSALVAQQALALSCLRPDVVRSYEQAALADEIYVMLLGRFTFDAAELPKGQDVQPPGQDRSASLSAEFVGHGLNRSGFVVPVERSVTLSVQCWAAWCGGLASGGLGMAFAERTAEGYVVKIDPCGTQFFPDPSDAMIEQAVACMQGHSCRSD